MKNQNIFKVLLSLSLGLIFILLMNIKITGLLFHEIFGIIIFIGIITHNIFNWKWTKGISKNLFKNKVKIRAKFMYFLVILLFLSIGTITLTGILMSKYIFTSISYENILLIKSLHTYTSYFAVFIISIHFLLHTKYILISLNKIFTNIKDKNIRVTLAQFSIVVVLIIVLYFPLTNYLSSTDSSIDDDTIALEEIIDDIPSESTDILENDSLADNNTNDSLQIENESTSEADENKDNIANNDLNNNSENNVVSNNKPEENTSQNNTVADNIPQHNNNNNNTPTDNTVNNPVEIPPVSTTPPVEEDNTEDDTTIDSGDNLQAELAAYLKRLGCNGCSRGCMLDDPFCTVGIQKAAKAKEKFLQFHTNNTLDDKFII